MAGALRSSPSFNQVASHSPFAASDIVSAMDLNTLPQLLSIEREPRRGAYRKLAAILSIWRTNAVDYCAARIVRTAKSLGLSQCSTNSNSSLYTSSAPPFVSWS